MLQYGSQTHMLQHGSHGLHYNDASCEHVTIVWATDMLQYALRTCYDTDYGSGIHMQYKPQNVGSGLAIRLVHRSEQIDVQRLNVDERGGEG